MDHDLNSPKSNLSNYKKNIALVHNEQDAFFNVMVFVCLFVRYGSLEFVDSLIAG